MKRPTWTLVRSVVSFFLGVWTFIYEARYATVVSPELVVGALGLIGVPLFAGADTTRGTRGRHRQVDREDDAA